MIFELMFYSGQSVRRDSIVRLDRSKPYRILRPNRFDAVSDFLTIDRHAISFFAITHSSIVFFRVAPSIPNISNRC